MQQIISYLNTRLRLQKAEADRVRAETYHVESSDDLNELIEAGVMHSQAIRILDEVLAYVIEQQAQTVAHFRALASQHRQSAEEANSRYLRGCAEATESAARYIETGSLLQKEIAAQESGQRDVSTMSIVPHMAIAEQGGQSNG